MSKWLDISTAPKEAKRPYWWEWMNKGPLINVLIEMDVTIVSSGWYSPKDECWRWLGDDGPNDIQPVKWQPLPDPPKSPE